VAFQVIDFGCFFAILWRGIYILPETAKAGRRGELLCIIEKQWEATGKFKSPLSYLCTRKREKQKNAEKTEKSCNFSEKTAKN
jgi:hypothetical protein